MRRLLAICLLSLLGACETQGLGQRCEETVNCGAGARCVLFMNPSQTCTGQNCVCCPTDPDAGIGITGCGPGAPVIDAGFEAGSTDAGNEAAVSEAGTDATSMTDVADAASACNPACPSGSVCDTAAHVCRRSLGQSCATTAECDRDLFCDNNVCRLQRGIGQSCGDGTFCQSTFCVSGVCCNAACTGAGYVCNDPASPGVCEAPVVTDAGTPDAGLTDASGG